MKEKLIDALEKSRNYTLQMAEAMPEKNYDFKPAATVWSFKELMNHIAYSMQWMEENYLLGKQTDWNPPAPADSKKKIGSYLSDAYDSLKKEVSGLKEVDAGKAIAFLSILEHTAHHRGQAATYLRCNNITQPEYPF